MSYDLVLKYIILGDTGVGKSCLSQQFRDKSFKQPHDPTIGADFGARIVTINGKKTKVQIWDTAGQEQFKSITQNYYRGAAGGILVYDITRRESFTRAASWLEDLRRHCTDNMTIMLIGNKSDLDDKRAVSTEEGSQFAQVHGLIFAECSAKTARNVEEAFTRTAIAIQESISNAQDLTALEHRGIRIVASNSGTRTEYESLSPRENRNRNRGSCCS